MIKTFLWPFFGKLDKSVECYNKLGIHSHWTGRWVSDIHQQPVGFPNLLRAHSGVKPSGRVIEDDVGVEIVELQEKVV